MKRELSFLVALCHFLGANSQVPSVRLTLNGALSVAEGESRSVCIDVNDTNLLDLQNPPTVILATEDSNNDGDYIPLSLNVTLNLARICHEIMTIDDDVVEPLELITVVLSNPNGVVIDVHQVQFRIRDNGDRISIDFVSGELSGTEGSELTSCVMITDGSNQLPLDVNFRIIATHVTTDFRDFQIPPGDINIPIGSTVGNTTCITINLGADRTVEQREETFTLRFAESFSFVNVADTTKTVTIIDGDRGRVVVTSPLEVVEGNSSMDAFVITLGLPDGIDVTREIVYNVSIDAGTAVAGLDYDVSQAPAQITFPDGSTRTVMVDIIGDTISEPSETFTLFLTPVDPLSDNAFLQAFTILDTDPLCEELPPPANGFVDDGGRYVGVMATYSCEPAYRVTGNNPLTCSVGPMWDNVPPTCVIRRCPSPPALENGTFVVDDNTIDGTTTYTCNRGYQLTTNSVNTRTCLLSQMWSTETILCERGRCPVDVNSGIQWPWTLESTTAYRPCREAGAMFHAGPKASRRCNEEGEWEGADLTSCTIAEVGDPFILFWFVIDANQYTNEQEEPFVNSMKEVLDMNGVQYSRVTLKSVYIASVAVTFQVDLVEDEQASSISQLSSFVRDPESFSSFANYSVMEDGRGSVDIAVAATCRCSSADMGSSLQLCTGVALSPCNCADDGSCSCKAPFVGDGNSCTLDSDGDGYPDEPLDSPTCTEDSTLSYCIADVCPTIRNREQDPRSCDPTPSDDGFSGCPYEQDDVWGITWPATQQGEINTQPCPGGVETLGIATRVCGEDGNWGGANVLLCQSLAIFLVVEEAAERLPEANEEIEEVTPELLESVAVVSDQLVMATDSTMEIGLLPLDLQASNDVVAQVLNVLESSTEADIDDVPSEELVDVFNNILNETNVEGWTQLQTVGAGSQSLLQNTDRYGNYLATTVNDTDEPLMLTRENIVIAAQMVDSQNASDIVFPARPEQLGNFSTPERGGELAQITIPGDSISRLSAAGTNMTGVSIMYVIFRNIEGFLPINTTNLNDSRAESLVLSSQLNVIGDAIPYDLFVDNPITLNFSFEASKDTIEAYTGVFWDFSNPVGRGGWSSDGIQVISNETRDNVTTVVCSSTHLTSFAVLVDVSGGVTKIPKEEQQALEYVSYIGCIISTICLSITVVFYLSMGKKLFSAVHYFIHLNLSISLLLGYIVFLFGIKFGNSTQGGCGFVAALLQYLFLSAFCWMMCEGIMLYLMLIVVFSKLSKKWWFFLLLGYCTPLLFVVIGLAVRYRYYGVHGEDGELAFCWLSPEKGTIFAFVAPMIVIIVINLVFLVLALAALYRSQKRKLKQNDTKSSKKASALLKATVILLPLLGVTWLFGLLALNDNTTAFAWLFTIFNSFQGTAIFYFHVIRSKTVWSKISPRVSQIKESIFKSSKYQTSKSTYSTSGTQSSDAMNTRRRPTSEFELSSPGPSSTLSMKRPPLSSVSEADIESTSAPEETSPTKHNPTAGVVIANPSTTTATTTDLADGESSLNKEEIIENEVTKL